jgi:hypothetical protein
MKQILLILAAVVLVGCGSDETDTTMECYYCKEEIKQRALVCKHCGRENSYGVRRAEREAEMEMSDRQLLIHGLKKGIEEDYKNGKISRSEYEDQLADLSPGGAEYGHLMADLDYDSDGNKIGGSRTKSDSDGRYDFTPYNILVYLWPAGFILFSFWSNEETFGEKIKEGFFVSLSMPIMALIIWLFEKIF